MTSASRASSRGGEVQVGDAAHGQAGQVGHLVPAGAGHRDRQRADRGRLIHDREDRAVAGELAE
jgi:hypothetical protein